MIVHIKKAICSQDTIFMTIMNLKYKHPKIIRAIITEGNLSQLQSSPLSFYIEIYLTRNIKRILNKKVLYRQKIRRNVIVPNL